MKWVLKEASSGDMVRVALSELYHYGVYVSDAEIIQFGLPPTRARSAAELLVCATDLDTFLCGKFLEVAEFDRAERRKKRAPDEIVRIARSRIGEGGYQILYNNCEHFANECVFGTHESPLVEQVRKAVREKLAKKGE